MSAKFKPLDGQVIVVTGAVSGLGREAARLAAQAGAAVVLAAADEAKVRALCAEIGEAGGRCHPVLTLGNTCRRVAGPVPNGRLRVQLVPMRTGSWRSAEILWLS